MYYSIIIIIYLTNAVFSNDTKYIDLLPEKEKEEFLERIARRILADIKTKENSTETVKQLSKDELDLHDDFVKKIMEEEAPSVNFNMKVKPLEKSGNKIDETAKKRTKRNDSLELNVTTDKVDENRRSEEENVKTIKSDSDRKNIEKITNDNNTAHVSKETKSDADKQINDKKDATEEKVTNDDSSSDIEVKPTENSIDRRTGYYPRGEKPNPVTDRNSDEDSSSEEDEGPRLEARTQGIFEGYGENHDHEKTTISSTNDTDDLVKTTEDGVDLSSYSSDATAKDLSSKEVKSASPATTTVSGSFTISVPTTTEIITDIPVATTEKVYIPPKVQEELTTEVITTVATVVEEISTTEKPVIPPSRKRINNHNVTVAQTVLNHSEVTSTVKANESIHSSPVVAEEISTVRIIVLKSENDTNSHFKETINANDLKGNTNYETKVNGTIGVKLLINDTNQNMRTTEKTDHKLTTSKLLNRTYEITKIATKTANKTTDKAAINKNIKLTKRPYHGNDSKVYIINTKEMKITIEYNDEDNTVKNIQVKKVHAKPKNFNLEENNSGIGSKEFTTEANVPLTTLATEENGDSSNSFAAIKVEKNSVKVFRSNDFSKPMKTFYEANKGKTHNVFEIDNSKPFIEANTNKEQPHYVPIYEYSSKNAYYNAYNRFGPNEEDLERNSRKEEAEENTEEFHRDYYLPYDEDGNRKFRFGINRDHKTTKGPFLKLPKIVKPLKSTNLSDDYDIIETERRGESIESECLNSSHDEKSNGEKYSPDDYKNTHSSLFDGKIDPKNHRDTVSLIRQKMLEKGVFSIVDQYSIEEKENLTCVFTPSLCNVTDENKILRQRGTTGKWKIKNEENIAMDYFFDRHDDENGKTVVPNNLMHWIKAMKRNKESDDRVLDYWRRQNTSYFNDSQEQNPDGDSDEFVSVADEKNKTTDETIQIAEEIIKSDPKINITGENINIAGEHTPEPDTVPSDENENTQDTWEPEDNKVDTEEPITISKKINMTDLKNILKLLDAKDIIPVVDKLIASNAIIFNTRRSASVDTHVEIVKDLLISEDRAFKQFNWLKTTVNILAAFTKLNQLIDSVIERVYISPEDFQLLSYIVYLHKSAMHQAAETMLLNENLRKRKLPKIKNKKQGLIKDSGLINRVWLYRMVQDGHDPLVNDMNLQDLQEFLKSLESNLYSLHLAIKNIAKVTYYGNQNWFRNLKDLYITNSKRKVFEILAHLIATRLFDLIEQSALNGATENYVDYIKNNAIHVERTKQEFTLLICINDRFDSLSNE